MAATSLHQSTLLLLEDETLLRRRLTAQLGKMGAEITAVASLAEARQALRGLDFDFALLDLNLPDGRSLALFEEKLIPASTVAVIVTAEGGVTGAVEAIQRGAADYLVKPFEPDDVAARLIRARSGRQAKRVEQHRREQQTVDEQRFFFGPKLAAVKTQLDKILLADRRVQTTPPPVLIEGETGTGKTTLARWLHQNGPRSAGPLIEVNCAALPETLAESELFGHERGAFTDAREARIGLMEAAEGGTLFLDEMPSLSPAIQAKLLKALEDRTVRRVGGNRAIDVDVRIIAATSADLKLLVSEKKFRDDLYHRLDLFRVRIPPLRERGEDIVALAETLVTRVARSYGLAPRPIPPLGRERLLAHRWPGNVRELAHEIERSLVFDDDQLAFSSLAASTAAAGSGAAWLNASFQFPESGFSLEAAIDLLIEKALAQSEGNVSAAARLLGVSRDYVRYRLKDQKPE